MAYLIMLGSIFALVVGGGMVLEKLDLLDAPMVVPMPGLLAAIAAALYPISWALSVHWYEKREF